jgi:hypothetical protein
MRVKTNEPRGGCIVLGQVLIVTMRILFPNSVFLMVVFAIELRSCGFGKVSKKGI